MATSIVFDVARRQLRVELSDERDSARLAKWKPPAPRYPTGVFAKYARQRVVGGAGRGDDIRREWRADGWQAELECEFRFATVRGARGEMSNDEA